ncbi:MAG: bifunctional 2-C-methyl-D-erythritol 4-phosphate cytidylyltransferase/2-C-methyl-D-erythritol 2,4-cyclodiphosphate synthase, partial [Rubrivivax sp.]
MTGTRTIAAIIVAAGRGERASAGADPEPKQYRALHGEAVLSRTIRAFLGNAEVNWVLPVIHPDHAQRYAGLHLTHDRLLPPAIGAGTRQGSVRAGLQALAPKRPDLVLIQ